MIFGVYLLIRKRAVLRYIWRLLAVYVCLLAPKGQANICVLYHIYCQKSSEIKEYRILSHWLGRWTFLRKESLRTAHNAKDCRGVIPTEAQPSGGIY